MLSMINYQSLKDWLKEENNKQKVVIGVCFVLVFLVGFGVGKFDKLNSRTQSKLQSNYTTKPKAQPVKQTDAILPDGQGIVAGTATSTSSSCLIKGNISSGGKKIYHV